MCRLRLRAQGSLFRMYNGRREYLGTAARYAGRRGPEGRAECRCEPGHALPKRLTAAGCWRHRGRGSDGTPGREDTDSQDGGSATPRAKPSMMRFIVHCSPWDPYEV